MTSLLSIIALARAGALAGAWRLFREAGFDRVDDDAAVLSVHGRLLKDSAAAASGAAQTAAFHSAAAAYARAATLGNATYPLINAATLSLLAGEPAAARDLALQVIARLDSDHPDAETPYYRAATRAEALLLLDDPLGADAALSEAMRRAPLAHEDQASTLRQFELILACRKADATWLDRYRPPRTLHFAGHLAVDGDTAGLSAEITEVLTQERIGSAYGALAAGADIVVAEALLTNGAILHAVLPSTPGNFVDTSVSPFGHRWAERFRAVLAAAESVHIVGASGTALNATAISLASEIAMGRAAFAARLFATEAVQLLVIDPAEIGPTTRDAATLWRLAGRRSHRVDWPRAETSANSWAAAAGVESVLAATLRVRFATSDDLAASLATVATAIHATAGLLVAPSLSDAAIDLAYARPEDAATAAAAVRAAIAVEIAIGGHYGLAKLIVEPFRGGRYLIGDAPRRAGRIADLTPMGANFVSEDFVSGVFARRAPSARIEHVGDDESSGSLTRMFSFAQGVR